jgi:hypothetical protein
MGRPPKTSWEPCCVCGGDGERHDQVTPKRLDMGRFGIEGKGCHACYNRLDQRQKRGQPADPLVIRRPYTPRPKR